ncbi:response regulator [Desertivirga arenae]|uniref:response regulator n=1 Tax=Desertivirga arenae TaxID=2810309 RepID=UPI001A978CEB|nr:response regulator [Pedobacter sp. SYSU D00823]
MKRVLVCDDEQDILDIIEFVLADAGWEVFTTTHVNDILDQVESSHPSVILMDNWIPGTGGITATKTIKSHPPFRSIPVVYITANNDINHLASEAGADYALPKPFDLDLLEKVVEEAYLKREGGMVH